MKHPTPSDFIVNVEEGHVSVIFQPSSSLVSSGTDANRNVHLKAASCATALRCRIARTTPFQFSDKRCILSLSCLETGRAEIPVGRMDSAECRRRAFPQ